MSCRHRLNDYGLVKSSSMIIRPVRQEGGDVLVVAPSSSLLVPRILATSAIPPDDGLCKHQKDFFAHWKPKALVVGTLRVIVQQGGVIMASFMSDQLEADMKRNKLVQEGSLTQGEADEQSQEWENVEWEKRWKPFPQKFFAAWTKYHFITLFMRCFESLASYRYDRVILDKLTMDPMVKSKQVGNNKMNSNATIAKEMFGTTFWAYLISYLADYSVHQLIICYGYYVYIRRKRLDAVTPQDKHAVLYDGAVWTSMLRKSTQLFASRAIGLVCSSIGGALGTLWWPGWGCMILSNMGDGVGVMIVDDGQSSSSSKKGNSTTDEVST